MENYTQIYNDLIHCQIEMPSTWAVAGLVLLAFAIGGLIGAAIRDSSYYGKLNAAEVERDQLRAKLNRIQTLANTTADAFDD